MLKVKKSKVRVGKKKERPSLTVAPAVAYGTKSVTKTPRIASANGGCVITHSEPISGVISVLNTDTIFSYPINPGDAVTFPWLGQIANAWDFYQFRSLRFRFISRLPSTVYSTVVLSIDYDVLDNVPTNLIEMRQMSGAISGNGWMPLSINWNPSGILMGSGNRKTRINSVSPDNLTDVGRLIVGVNTSNATICGEIWADYTVALFKPQQVQPVETYGADLPGASETPILPSVVAGTNRLYNMLVGSLVSGTSNLPVSLVPSPFGESPAGGYALRIRLPWLLENRDIHVTLSNRTVFNENIPQDLSVGGVLRPTMYTQSSSNVFAAFNETSVDQWISEFLVDTLVYYSVHEVLGFAYNHFMSFHIRVPDTYQYTAQSTIAIYFMLYLRAYFSDDTPAPADLFSLLGSDLHIDPGPKEILPNDFDSDVASRNSYSFKGQQVQVRDGSSALCCSPAHLSSRSYLVEPREHLSSQSVCCCPDLTGSTTAATDSPTLSTQRPAACPCCSRT